MDEFEGVAHAAQLLSNGELVVIPTETVYGLAANAYDDKAVGSIFQAKNRPATNPLILHIKDLSELPKVARDIPLIAWQLAEKFWPGPLTLILNKQPHISDLVSANHSTVAVRVPNHPLTLHLLESLSFPLVAPSANRSNHISPTSAEHVYQSLGENTPFVLDGGPCSAGVESTIIGFDGDQAVLYRYGALQEKEIEAITGRPLLYHTNLKEQGISPGSSRKHYSPETSLVISDTLTREYESSYKRIGYLVLNKTFDVNPQHVLIELSPSGSMEEAASNLYAALHELDKLKLDLIVAQRFPDAGLGKTINDRLNRAASIEKFR